MDIDDEDEPNNDKQSIGIYFLRKFAIVCENENNENNNENKQKK